MPTHTCTCGARYKFAESNAGKKARCKRCNTVFRLEVEDEGPIPIADDPPFQPFADLPASATAPAATVPAAGATAAPPAGWTPESVVIERAAKPEPEAAPRNYLTDLINLPLFFIRPDNLVIFVVIWLLMSFSAYLSLVAAGIFLTLAYLTSIGIYCAFRFAVITEAASGEKHLCDASLSTDGWWEIFASLFKWLGSWLVVFVPALSILGIATWVGSPITGGVSYVFAGGVSDFFSSNITKLEAGFAASVLLGLFMWPIVILCIGLAGFSSLSRLDLIFSTVVRTLPVYLLTVALVFVAEFLGPLWDKLAQSFSVFTAVALGVYLDIIAMRAIGLYYHHFKHRFAWSWD